MLRTLFVIHSQIAGMPVFGFGLLLAVWVTVSLLILAWLAWRQGWNADTLGYVPVLLLIGVIIVWLLPALCIDEGLPIRGYGVMVFLGVVAGTALAAWRGRRLGLDADAVFSLAFWMLVPGILGGRAFYVIEYWETRYWPAFTDPDGGGLGKLIATVASVNQGGLVVFGAFFGGVVGLLAFAYRRRLPLLALCDLIAPSMALGLAIGRIGCFMNGCCYGAMCDHSWAVTFPPDSPPYDSQVERGLMYGFTLDANPETPPIVRHVEPDSPAACAGLKAGEQIKRINDAKATWTGHVYWMLSKAVREHTPLAIVLDSGTTIRIPAIPIPAHSLPIHPTQIYSVINGLILCLLLLAYAPFRRRDGELFALLISIYPITRFFVESLRCDEAAVFGTGMSISQNVSLLLLTAAVALWTYILWQPPGTYPHKQKAALAVKKPRRR